MAIDFRSELMGHGRSQPTINSESLQALAMHVWRSLHDYGDHSCPLELAALPPRPAGSSDYDLLPWTENLRGWLEAIHRACAHYIGWCEAEKRRQHEPEFKTEFRDASDRLHELAAQSSEPTSRVAAIIKETEQGTDENGISSGLPTQEPDKSAQVSSPHPDAEGVWRPTRWFTGLRGAQISAEALRKARTRGKVESRARNPNQYEFHVASVIRQYPNATEAILSQLSAEGSSDRMGDHP